MNDFKFKRFIPIAKVDEDERMVYGFASTPDLDSDGEVITVDAIKNALPSYLQYPTLREMHQPKVAGTVKSTDIDDKNGLYIGAKVVSDEAWKMVKEGVYRGFSIGGNVVRRAGNVINQLDLIEISLVDVPANKKAKIELWKKDNSVSNSLYSQHDSANNLLKVVILQMADKIKKDSDTADVVVEKEQPTEEVVETVKEVTEVETPKEDLKTDEVVETTEVVETPEVVDAPETPETVDTDQDVKEVSDMPTLDKLEKVSSDLDKVAVKEPVEAVVVNDELTKIVSKQSDLIVKMSDLIGNLEKRISTLEENPAPLKSKANFVFKNEVETPKEDNKVDSVKKNRLAELNTLFTQLGANEFAKQGYSKEYVELLDK